MPRIQPLLALAAGLIVSGAPSLCQASTDFADVNVAVEMTDAGKKVQHPTPGNPVYYRPVMAGYQELGAITANEPPPPTETEVAHIMAKVLADQGYLPMDPLHDPSIVVVFHYGCLNPVVGADGVQTNNDMMLAMVTGGKSLGRMELGWADYKRVMQNSRMDRYFILVTAYDYTAFVSGGKKSKLWQADISVPARGGVTLAGVFPIMARTAGPSLGYETFLPKSILAPLPNGHVEVGTAVELPNPPAAATPKAP